MLWNSYFAHQENALIAMLGDDNENVRNVGVAKELARQKPVAPGSKCLLQISQFRFLPAKAFSNCRPYVNRRVFEETSGITLSIRHSQSVEQHVKFIEEASAEAWAD